MSLTLSPLFTDLYQFTMFESYVRAGKAHEPACFDVFFRKAPDGAPFVICCGVKTVLEFIQNLTFEKVHLDYLASQAILTPPALKQLTTWDKKMQIWAVDEGTSVLAGMPMMRFVGPIGFLQILESPVLNLLNFETLIATKAQRIVRTACPATVVEFGLRRAHGFHAAHYGVRAAFVGGVVATSNVEAARQFGIPPSGTLSHAYVQSFNSEIDAFRQFAQDHPHNTVLLVDTYDTLTSGVPNALRVAKEMSLRGQRLAGIRLDSGDPAEISMKARKMLDEAGFKDVLIFASNDLDEFKIHESKARGSRIDAYGVGTRLITSFSEPALGGVFKLCAVQQNGQWIPKNKTTSDSFKATLPGLKQVFRLRGPHGEILGDLLCPESAKVQPGDPVLDMQSQRSTGLPSGVTLEPLLKPVWEADRPRFITQNLKDIQTTCREQVEQLPQASLDLFRPQPLWRYRIDFTQESI